ncbi:MAG: hypothetical protein ACRDFX_10335 [Chloroflexota bacterium]
MTRTRFLCLAPLVVVLGAISASASGRHQHADSGASILSRHAITTDGHAIFVAWSPDGKSLLFRDNVLRHAGSLWIASISGHGRRLGIRGSVADAAFARDGRHILYMPSTPCCTPPILRIGLNGRRPTQVVRPGFHVISTQVLVNETGSLRNSVLARGRIVLDRAGKLYVYRPDRRGLRPMAAVHLGPAMLRSGLPSAAISPSGEWLALIGRHGGLVVRSVRSGRVFRMLLKAPAYGAGVTQVSWSPDSSHLLYQTGETTGSLREMNLRTGISRTVMKISLETVGGFTWSPTGERIAFTIAPTGVHVGAGNRLLIASANGTSLRELDTGGMYSPLTANTHPGETSPVWSPENPSIGYTRLYERGRSAGNQSLATDAWVARLRMRSSRW